MSTCVSCALINIHCKGCHSFSRFCLIGVSFTIPSEMSCRGLHECWQRLINFFKNMNFQKDTVAETWLKIWAGLDNRVQGFLLFWSLRSALVFGASKTYCYELCWWNYCLACYLYNSDMDFLWHLAILRHFLKPQKPFIIILPCICWMLGSWIELILISPCKILNVYSKGEIWMKYAVIHSSFYSYLWLHFNHLERIFLHKRM